MKPTAKDYYRNYVADDRISPLNEKLVEVIQSFKPRSVLEFGCGVGKNLGALGIKNHLGIDISPRAVEAAEKRGLNVICGDERQLRLICEKSFDVVFTCSVLDHIDLIGDILADMLSIARKAVVLAETNDVVGPYYYPHDYGFAGFKDTTGYSYESRKEDGGDGATYRIWVWQGSPPR